MRSLEVAVPAFILALLRALADRRLVACHFPLSQVAASKATTGDSGR